jgi:glycosyltransferase involved in cell wall biosynthesis
MSNDSPLVSTVMIFLNAERFLAEAVESVFAQTYERWELLLVDDGSTDGSSDVAKRYADEHADKVSYLEHPRHENRGMSASRNVGIRNARGEFVALLDADDVWLPQKLAEQVALARTHPDTGMICGATEYWWSWSDPKRNNVIIPLGARLDALHQPPELSLALYPLGRGAAPCPSDLLIRRDVCERVGGFEEHFRRELQMYEDQAFLAKVYIGTPVYVAATLWDRHRQHTASCVSTVTRAGHYHAVRHFFLNWFAEYLRERNNDESTLWQALEQALWPYRHPIRAGVARLLHAAR